MRLQGDYPVCQRPLNSEDGLRKRAVQMHGTPPRREKQKRV
jgi:hypothetical protein